jgi:hypothetical protein
MVLRRQRFNVWARASRPRRKAPTMATPPRAAREASGVVRRRRPPEDLLIDAEVLAAVAAVMIAVG